MAKLTAYLWFAIFLATPAIAQDRSFVYTDEWEGAFTLQSLCTTEKFEHEGELLFRDVSMETTKMMIARAKEMGFTSGGCMVPIREAYTEMGATLRLGMSVLHLTADEIEEFRKVNEDIEDFKVSETWPPNS